MGFVSKEFQMPENAAAEGGFGRDAPSRPDENDRGGAREDKEKAEKARSFERTMDNANRPDRAPAAPAPTVNAANDNDDDDRNDEDDGSKAGSNDGKLSTPEKPDVERPDEDGQSGLLDRAGDVFGGIARGIQDFARDNPRVDSHGDPVGLIDADGLQRGEIASGVMASGVSSEDLANQLGFSSPAAMSAHQTTAFIEAKYQEDLARRAIEEALNERYGHPSVIPVLDVSPDSLESAHAAALPIDEVPLDLSDLQSVSIVAPPYLELGYIPASQPKTKVDFWDRIYNFGMDFATRSLGLAQAGGGILEMGVGGLLSTTGIGTVIGVPLGLHGADNYRAGLYTLQTGEFQPTLTEQLLNEGLAGAGIDPGIAGSAAIAADALIGVGNPGTALRHVGRETLENAATTFAPPRTTRPVISHQGRQGLHIPGHENFQPGKSELTHPDPDGLVARFTGLGEDVPTTMRRGEPGYIERVDFDEVIGTYIDQDTGFRQATARGIIVYDEIYDAVIIPSRPR